MIFILEEGIKLQIYKSVEKDINMIRSLVLMCIQVFMFCDKSKVMSLNPFIQWWAKSKFGEFIGQNKDDWQGKIEQKVKTLILLFIINSFTITNVYCFCTCSFGQIYSKWMLKMKFGNNF